MKRIAADEKIHAVAYSLAPTAVMMYFSFRALEDIKNNCLAR